MDGVVLALPPTDPTERFNYCRHGEEYIWRKTSEAFSPKLSENTEYGSQVPLARAIPIWGGCSASGFAVIAFHKTKKMCASEWEKVVKRGALVDAIKFLQPVKLRGP